MSTEFDASFEAFMLDVFDIENASSESSLNNTHISCHCDDNNPSPFNHNILIDDNSLIDDDPVRQSKFDNSEADHLRGPELAPLSSEVTTSSLNLPLQETDFDIDESDKDMPIAERTWRCPWTACPASSALKMEKEAKAHLEEHWNDVSRQWSGASKCNWPKCPSKATFINPGQLRLYVYNIHVNPLVCTVPQCSYTRPFGKRYDLERHTSTAHKELRSYWCWCPIESCEASRMGFGRKDKLLKHMRENHRKVWCPYNHCSVPELLETQEELHIQQSHGSLECSLGACGRSPASCFREDCKTCSKQQPNTHFEHYSQNADVQVEQKPHQY